MKGEDSLSDDSFLEIRMWRSRYLDNLFEGKLAFVPARYKARLENYFLSIPSQQFTTPDKELMKCVCVLLQWVGNEDVH